MFGLGTVRYGTVPIPIPVSIYNTGKVLLESTVQFVIMTRCRLYFFR